MSTLNAAVDPRDVVESHFQLTDQQRTILRILAAGHQIQQIADKVGLSDRAVGWHLKNIRTKLRTRSNAHSVALAMGLDLI